jgi:peptidoglycan/xylan/chitin deacetylase (PgdA/CDA1 family)
MAHQLVEASASSARPCGKIARMSTVRRPGQTGAVVTRLSRRDTERARLARLTLVSVVMVGAAMIVDTVRSGVSERSEAEASKTTTTMSPPMTIAPLSANPGMAPVITRVETTDPVVFLTIDDGWTREPEALAAFEEAGVPATLFVLDAPIIEDAEFFRSMPDTLVEGHTQTHVDLTTVSYEQQRAEICGNADTIERTFGRRPVLFRPPYGEHNEATLRAAADCGMDAVVLWEQSLNGDVVSYRSETRFRPGDIILMHFRPDFVDELHTAMRHAEGAGLEFALLEDYIVPESVPASSQDSGS